MEYGNVPNAVGKADGDGDGDGNGGYSKLPVCNLWTVRWERFHASKLDCDVHARVGTPMQPARDA